MSIASEISRIQQAKSDLATSIENKGVTVPAATTLDGYAALVDSIPSGVNIYDEMRDNLLILVPYSSPFNTSYGLEFNFVTGKTYKIILKSRHTSTGNISIFAYKGSANTPNTVVGTMTPGNQMAEFTYTHTETATYTRIGIWVANSGDRNQNYSCAVHIEEV